MVKVRIFKDADAAQVSKLIRKTMMSANTKDYPISVLKPLHDYFTPKKVKILASERYCLVAEIDGKIVGTGAIEDGTLKTVFVDPKYQGRGIGKKLIAKLEGRAQKGGVKTMEVAASLTGVQFYEKLGYKRTKTFMSEYAGPQILMKKSI